MHKKPIALMALLIGLFGAGPAMAQAALVAVAANFSAPAQKIAQQFEAETGATIALSFGATGMIYNQIKHGAPYDIFLAADDVRPQQLVMAGYGVANTAFTYAIGRLVLWSSQPDLVKDQSALLAAPVKTIAYANPKTAPYGQSAVDTLIYLNLYQTLKPKLVEGQNIAQAYIYVKSQSADLGFVAYSQIIGHKTGSYWLVPQHYHSPIRQQAVLLKTGEKNATASAFFSYLKSAKARKIIEEFGYETAMEP